MRYSEEVIEEIRNRNDIVEIISGYTNLKQKGGSYMGICPFHKETTPSLSVSFDKQLYHCFGCGVSGTVFNFIMGIENYEFIDALKYLADRANYTLPENTEDKTLNIKNILYEIHKIVARKFYENLISENGIIARNYLNTRKINNNIRIKYGIGYSLPKSNDIYLFLKEKGYTEDIILKSGLVIKSKTNNTFFDRFTGRLMFPIIDDRSRVIGFGGRLLINDKKKAKYLNSPDTLIFNKSDNLYSINIAKNSKLKELILVEGYMDVIALYQIGVINAVASLGTAFNKNHIKLFRKYASKVIILFDTDEAGKNATNRAIPIFVNAGVSPKICILEGSKDPDEFINKYGKDKFLKKLSASINYIIYQIHQKLNIFDISDPVEKVHFLKEATKIIRNVEDLFEREVFMKEICSLTDIKEDTFLDEIKMLNSKNSDRYSTKSYKNDLKNNDKLDEAKRNILYIIATNIDIYAKIKPYIVPKNFLNQTYIKLAEIIFDYNDNNKIIYPPEIALKFDTNENQQQVSKVFMSKLDFNKKDEIEKALNDYLKVIKKSYFDIMILDEKLTTKILQEKKAFDKIYINI